MNEIPKRIATTVINSLKGGVVPRIGLPYIAVGREAEINALLHDISIIEDGGASFRFVVGKFGSGKSFLLQTIRSYAMDKGFVIVDADLSPERRLHGTKGQGLATYRELIKNMSTKTRPDGGALPLILDKWINTIRMEVVTSSGGDEASMVEKRIFEVVNDLQEMVNGYDFARLLVIYYKATISGDDEQKAKVIHWFRGEYTTKTEAKNDLSVNIIINDDNFYEYIKVFALFLVKAGYKGLLVLIDELVNIYRIPNSITRQYNYEKILTIYNDTLQGKAKYIGFIMGGTPQCIEDTRKGVFSYEALKSRLSQGRFATETSHDMLAPIIRLIPLTSEEMYVLVEKLAHIHAVLYDYVSTITADDMITFIKIEYGRIGADTGITPREVIRDFIELLNIVYQNKEMSIPTILNGDAFKFSLSSSEEKELVSEEFRGFEI